MFSESRDNQSYTFGLSLNVPLFAAAKYARITAAARARVAAGISS